MKAFTRSSFVFFISSRQKVGGSSCDPVATLSPCRMDRRIDAAPKSPRPLTARPHAHTRRDLEPHKGLREVCWLPVPAERPRYEHRRARSHICRQRQGGSNAERPYAASGAEAMRFSSAEPSRTPSTAIAPIATRDIDREPRCRWPKPKRGCTDAVTK
jgi:hypothetical protein